MLQAAETASRYDPILSEKIKIQVGMYRKIQHNPQEEIKSLYLCIENTFYHPYPERERNTDKTITVIDDNRVLNDILPEMGYGKSGTTKNTRKCCSVERNLPIPSRILFPLNAILPEINSTR